MVEVSVIIPTYNRAHLLDRAVQSVLTQTFRNFEIIVIDDSSIDNTEQIVAQFKNDRIHYLRHDTNKGGSAARNTGINHARGNFIAFLDSDDEWLPDKLEKQVRVLKNSPEETGIVYTDYYRENRRVQSDFEKHDGNIFSLILTKNFVGTVSTVLIKKECFEKAGVFDESLPSCQDWDMWIRIANRYQFKYIAEKLVRHYFQATSISSNPQASIDGHKMITMKYRNLLNELPGKHRAAHYFNLGKNFWWKKNVVDSLTYFGKSAFADLSIVPTIVSYLFIDKIKKIAREKEI